MEMKLAIVVGTGAGGATVAKELQGKFDVTILEAGGQFKPFSMNMSTVLKFKKYGMMFDAREIGLMFPAMNVRKTQDRMVLVRGIGLGGTTTLATGNGVRLDGVLKELGIDLHTEYDELDSEVPVSSDHQKRWRPATRRLFDICREMQLNPQPLPKMGDNKKCINCGRCVLGCEQRAKWDSRRFLDLALSRGARLVTNCRVKRLAMEGDKAVGVVATKGFRSELYRADLIVIAAGGFGTPVILQNSGIACEQSLFVDPVLCVATEWKGSSQNREIAMPFVVQRDGFILAPYFDYLSYFFRGDWKCAPEDTLGIMIKIADSNVGNISGRVVEKSLSNEDNFRLQEGVKLCIEIFRKLGANTSKVFLGTLNAGHPGGMLPLKDQETITFHPSRLPENVYVADASLIPASLGNPPMYTIMAMAKRVSKMCCA
jgi:choline dehydrogenase-like flavoprotein